MSKFIESFAGSKCFIIGENKIELNVSIYHLLNDIDHCHITIDKIIYNNKNNIIYACYDNGFGEVFIDYDDNDNMIHKVHLSNDYEPPKEEHYAIYDSDNNMIFRKSYYDDEWGNENGNYTESYFRYDRNNNCIYRKELTVRIGENDYDEYLSLNNRLEDFESYIEIYFYDNTDENICIKTIDIYPDDDILEKSICYDKNSNRGTITSKSNKIAQREIIDIYLD